MGKSKGTSLARLIPKSIEVKDGETVIRIAGDADENRILNYLLAGNLRTLLEETIQKYRDGETKLSPQELKQLTEAGRNIAEFSAEIYKGGEPVKSDAEKIAEKTADTPDFSSLNAVEIKP